MTLTNFSKARFGKGDRVIYNGEEYLIASLDFEEMLIGFIPPDRIKEYEKGLEKIQWARCENCEHKPLVK